MNKRGYTLTEMLIVLIILSITITGVAVLGVTFSHQVEKRAFEAEAETVCRFFNDSRKLAMMENAEIVMDINDDIITRTKGNNKKTLKLSHLKLYNLGKGTRKNPGSFYSYVAIIHFTGAGTISRGATYYLTDNRGNNCYLVVQPVTGRIYLNHEKPKK